jgi:hypothetical protein
MEWSSSSVTVQLLHRLVVVRRAAFYYEVCDEKPRAVKARERNKIEVDCFDQKAVSTAVSSQ